MDIDHNLERQTGGTDPRTVKKTGMGVKIRGIAGCIKAGLPSTAACLLDLRMPLQVIGQAFCYDRTLGDNPDIRWHKLTYLIDQQRIMCAGQEYAINLAIPGKQVNDMLLDKIIRAGRMMFIVLDQGNPHRAGLLFYPATREKLGYFDEVRTGSYRAGCSHNPDMPRLGISPNDFGGWPDNAQHFFVLADPWQVVLLYRSERFGRCGIACQDDQLATLAEKPFHTLQRIGINGVEATGAIRSPGIVAEIKIIVDRKFFDDLTEYGQSAITTVEYANWSLGHVSKLHDLLIFPWSGE